MQAELHFDTEEFRRSMDELSEESDYSDAQIITANARTLIKSLAWNTPYDTGNLRAGWWPAWYDLGMTGWALTRSMYQPDLRESGVTYVPQGKFDDQRKARGPEKSYTMVNQTHKINKSGKKVYYGYVLDARTHWIAEGEEEANFKFGRTYERLLKKHGKL